MKNLTKHELQEELFFIEKAKSNPRHFSWIYEKYYERIFAFVYRRCNNYDTAGDITSQVFLKALHNLHRYVFKGVPFVAWLFRVASNEVNMYFRENKNNRTISIEDAGMHMLSEEVDEKVDIQYLTELLVEAIEELADKEVTLLELRYFEGRSVKEVAYILNESESNVKVKSHRIIKKLKKLMDPGLSDE